MMTKLAMVLAAVAMLSGCGTDAVLVLNAPSDTAPFRCWKLHNCHVKRGLIQEWTEVWWINVDHDAFELTGSTMFEEVSKGDFSAACRRLQVRCDKCVDIACE